jgi:hypothetical protein
MRKRPATGHPHPHSFEVVGGGRGLWVSAMAACTLWSLSPAQACLLSPDPVAPHTFFGYKAC